mmetsp:Transcript_23424/g.61109  ORF Transcript_23424/g.61109 Transcript_23424/m.61109 type:complete len:356 (+) Transcript_23424:150-1217(+)
MAEGKDEVIPLDSYSPSRVCLPVARTSEHSVLGDVLEPPSRAAAARQHRRHTPRPPWPACGPRGHVARVLRRQARAPPCGRHRQSMPQGPSPLRGPGSAAGLPPPRPDAPAGSCLVQHGVQECEACASGTPTPLPHIALACASITSLFSSTTVARVLTRLSATSALRFHKSRGRVVDDGAFGLLFGIRVGRDLAGLRADCDLAEATACGALLLADSHEARALHCPCASAVGALAFEGPDGERVLELEVRDAQQDPGGLVLRMSASEGTDTQRNCGRSLTTNPHHVEPLGVLPSQAHVGRESGPYLRLHSEGHRRALFANALSIQCALQPLLADANGPRDARKFLCRVAHENFCCI